MRRERVKVALLILLAAILLAGCAMFGGGKNFVDMSAKEKSVYFMKWYNVQFDDAARMGTLAQQGKLTTGQTAVYRVKRDVLIKAKPLIAAYDLIAGTGGTPTAEQEQQILDLINRLATAAGGGA